MRKDLIIGAAAGVLSGVMHTAPFGGPFGAMILAFLALLPLFAVGLSMGLMSALAAGIAGVAAVMLVGGPGRMLTYAGAFAVPVSVLVRQALLNRQGPDGVEWYPAGLLLCWLTGFGIAMGLYFMVQLSGPEMAESMQQFLAGMFSQLNTSGEADIAAFAATVLRFLPGMVAASWMIVFVINGALAQGLLSGFNRSLRPSPAMRDIRLPLPLVLLFPAALLATMLPGKAGEAGVMVLFVVSVPLFLQGLAVVHALAGRQRSPMMLLTITYAMLVFMYSILMPLFVLLGFIEYWARFCQRLAPQTGPNEEDE